MRRITILVVLTAVAALTASVAAAAVSQSYQLSGSAVVSSQGTTSMSGFAVGSNGDRGFWRASVTTGPLSACATLNSSCDITGGTFTLNTRSGSITGTLSGAVTLTSQSQRSGDRYTVLATVATAAGTEELNVVVTTSHGSHGSCFSFGSSVQGSLTPAFTAPGG